MPDSPKIGVAAAVKNHLGEFLAVRRGHAPEEGRWALPGGHLEWGESLADAVRREVYEEVQIDIVPGPLLHVAEIIIPSAHFIVLDFAAEIKGSEFLRPDSDAAEARWISPDDLGQFSWAAGMSVFFQDAKVRSYLCL